MTITKTKHNGRDEWKVDFRVAGKRQRVFFITKDAAEKYAESVVAETRELGERAHNITHEERMELETAKQILAGTGATLLEAVRFFREHALCLTPKTLQDAAQECVTAKEVSGKRPRYIKCLRRNLNRFVRDREQTTCDKVTREQIETWLATCGNSPATRKSILGDVGTFFSFASTRRWVTSNPCNGIERIMLEDTAPVIFTPAQAEAWMHAAQEHDPLMIPFLAFGMFAGIRPEEIRRLDWSDVRLADKLVVISGAKAKTRQRRIVTLPDNCVAWLTGVTDLPRIKYQSRKADLRAKSPSLVWGHDVMRHSFVSYHIALHGDAAKTALEAGHTQQVLFAKYREIVTHADAKKYFAIMPKAL